MNILKTLSSSQNQLYQLVYISQVKDETESTTMLGDIISVSKLANEKNNLTGVLWYGNGWFFQYLEGSKQALQQLKDNLTRDNRHCNVTFLNFSNLAKRRFSSWSMQLLMCGQYDDRQIKGLMPLSSSQWRLTQWQDFLQLLMAHYDVSSIRNLNSHDDDYKQQNGKDYIIKTMNEFLGQHLAFLTVQAVLSLLILLSIYFLLI